MAKIDAMLRMMTEKKVERAVLTGDKPYRIQIAGRTTEVGTLSRQQLIQLLEEIVPPSLAPSLKAGTRFQFQYSSPFGIFDFSVPGGSSELIVEVKPVAASGFANASSRPTPTPSSSFAPGPTSPQTSSVPPALQPLTPGPPITPGPPVAPTPPASQSLMLPPSSPTSGPPVSPAHTAAPHPQYPPAPNPGYPPQPYYPAPVPQHTIVNNYYPSQFDPGMRQMSHRSKVAAGLLGILLPGLGIHRFYLGYTGMGIFFILMTFVFSWFTCFLTAGIAGIWGTIEGIIILTGGMNDVDGRPLS